MRPNGNHGLAEKALAVCISSVPNGYDVYCGFAVIYGINHTVVTGADAPKRSFSPNLSTANRPRLKPESLDEPQNSLDKGRLQRFQFLTGRARKRDGIISHPGSACLFGATAA